MVNTFETPNFNEPHSLGIRIWHWIFFILITASMTTVWLASTTFRTRNNIGLVHDQLQQHQLTVDQDQARAVAHAFNDKLWDLHTWIGYLIGTFLLGRFILELFQPGEERLINKIKRSMGITIASTVCQQQQKHYLRVKWGYVLFYGLILIMALTGLGLAFEDVPFFKSIHGTIKQIHSLTQYAIYAFVVIHLAGVILADAGDYPGVVSGMINGRKRF